MAASINSNKKSSFWSQGTIFSISVILSLFSPFLGVAAGFIFLLVNSLKMRAVWKFVVYIIVSIICLCLLDWVSPNRGAVSLLQSNGWLWSYVIFFIAAEIIILGIVYLSGRDVKEFELKINVQVNNHWWFGLLSILIILAGFWGATSGLEFVSRSVGYCHRPNLYYMVLEKSEPQRTGLDIVLLKPGDMGCDWTWHHQIQDPDDPSKGSVILVGNYDKYFVMLLQYIWKHKNVTPEIFTNYKANGNEKAISFSGARFSNVTCNDDRKFTNCAVLLGTEHIVFRVDIMASGGSSTSPTSIPNDILQKIIQDIGTAMVAHMQQYETALSP